MKQKIKLSIIIVSWNVKALLEKCLDSIKLSLEGLSLETIVVDNASSDGSQEMLTSRDDIYLIINKSNLGFAQGNNIGLQQAAGEYILFLNPDTEILPGSLATMVDYLDKHHDCSVLGPKLLNPDRSLQWSVRKFPDLFSQILILLKLHNFFPDWSVFKRYYQTKFNYDQIQPVEQVMGAALMVKKYMLNKVRLAKYKIPHLDGRPEVKFTIFNSNYKRIFEEVDLCYRIKAAGHEIHYLPTAQIMHHKGSSFSKIKIWRKQLDYNQGMRLFFWLHKPRWQYFILLFCQPLSWLVTGLQATLNQLGYPLRKKYKKLQY